MSGNKQRFIGKLMFLPLQCDDSKCSRVDINDVLDSLLLYSDDIICFVSSASQHHQYLRLVLHLLKKFQLRASLSKARFFSSEIRYLGSWYSLNNQTTSICPLRLQDRFISQVRRLSPMLWVIGILRGGKSSQIQNSDQC